MSVAVISLAGLGLDRRCNSLWNARIYLLVANGMDNVNLFNCSPSFDQRRCEFGYWDTFLLIQMNISTDEDEVDEEAEEEIGDCANPVTYSYCILD